MYQTDPLRNTLSAYDVNHTAGARLAEEWWKFYGTREWLAGGFAWTGFDYRGEPTPYGWPSINSQFGIVDMCGFPKDNFFYYKAWWGKQPVLHLVSALELGGQGRRRDPGVGVLESRRSRAASSTARAWAGRRFRSLATWSGRCATSRARSKAHGWKDGKLVLTEKRETTGPAVALQLAADRTEIDADGEDVAILTCRAVDSQGRAVPTADMLVDLKSRARAR